MTIVWSAVLGLHILGAAAWVGGMLFALAVLHPSLAALDPAPRVAVAGQAFGRFFRVVWHVMPLVLLTGYAMLFGVYGGFAGAGWPIHVMHLLGLIMAALFVFVVTGPFRRFRTAVQPANALRAAANVRRYVWINLALGAVVIVVAAFGQW
jgi:uncharacterized membrane protein